jgi:hypothetical protein
MANGLEKLMETVSPWLVEAYAIFGIFLRRSVAHTETRPPEFRPRPIQGSVALFRIVPFDVVWLPLPIFVEASQPVMRLRWLTDVAEKTVEVVSPGGADSPFAIAGPSLVKGVETAPISSPVGDSFVGLSLPSLLGCILLHG